MNSSETKPLLVGEVQIDFTITERGNENKLRLGGVAHAARGFWALDMPFNAAVILPEYLEHLARKYFLTIGCADFRVLGYVRGAPNVTVIFDQIELADQGYDTLLREEKTVELITGDAFNVDCTDILIFPGNYDFREVCKKLPSSARIHVDVAYDLPNPSVLAGLSQPVESILNSTSSPLFSSIADGIEIFPSLIEMFNACGPATLFLKENRGGARMYIAETKEIEGLPAQLGITKNSVGVGDVFAAAYVALAPRGRVEAAWRATYAAAAYSQTTYPDDFRTYVQRDLKLTLEEMKNLGGALLAWEKRREFPIYFAGPDFSYADRHALDKAIKSLTYHNFSVRRPVAENRELPRGSPLAIMRETYQADYDLLKKCSLVFAVPTARDPGTLVEIGIAVEAGIPVVVYDPERENENAMVMAGAQHYSANLDDCLNAVFQILSKRLVP